MLPSYKIVMVADASGSSLLKVLVHFTDDLALGDVATAAKLFEKSQDETFTPNERETYNKYVGCDADLF